MTLDPLDLVVLKSAKNDIIGGVTRGIPQVVVLWVSRKI